jgi:energy-coupling factor transporter ATP-binding protein EcfA2
LLGILPSNLLLLDEPTNHLDIPAREAIESFMTDSPATLLVVSHDRRLLETVCTSLWVVDDGLAVPFAGGWREWRAAVAGGWTVQAAAEQARLRLAPIRRAVAASGVAAGAGERVAAGAGAATDGRGPVATGPRIADPRRTAARDRLSKDSYRRQRAVVDAELTRLGLRRSQLELAMASPAIAANFVEMRRVTSELADVEQALAAAEDAWLELEERAPAGGSVATPRGSSAGRAPPTTGGTG